VLFHRISVGFLVLRDYKEGEGVTWGRAMVFWHIPQERTSTEALVLHLD
jgi:hypothetical protein